MAETLQVALGERAYNILAGEKLLEIAGEHITPLLKGSRVIIVTDERVAFLYLHRLTEALKSHDITGAALVLPPGEAAKSFGWFESLLETLLQEKPDRDTMLIALGGGVVGDITGFAASLLLRGVDFIQIPTTLLAQVDSSIGGKTAINSSFGKNLIGSFHQPRLVLADVSLLSTLPRREMLAGYAEVVKYGLIRHPEFFAWLEQNGAEALKGDTALLTHTVIESCRAKATIVAADEREAGERALLNFGHTFAHALEAETGYSSSLLHGEAVAIGMVMAFKLSVALGLCPADDLERVLVHWWAVGLPASPLHVREKWSVDALMEHFTRDKKAKGGKLTFVLTRGIGQAFVAHDVDGPAVRNTVEACCRSDL